MVLTSSPPRRIAGDQQISDLDWISIGVNSDFDAPGGGDQDSVGTAYTENHTRLRRDNASHARVISFIGSQHRVRFERVETYHRAGRQLRPCRGPLGDVLIL